MQYVQGFEGESVLRDKGLDGMQEERNIFHEGAFVLIGEQRRIRGYYDELREQDLID